jgi:hypothetical protein
LLSLPAGRQGLTLSELFAIFKKIYYAGNRRVNIFLKRVLKNDKVTHQIKNMVLRFMGEGVPNLA